MFKQDQWHEIDTSTFTGATAKAYKAYVAASAELKEHRETLEGAMAEAVSGNIADGLEARFAYRWGKVSVAAVEPRARSKSGGKIKL